MFRTTAGLLAWIVCAANVQPVQALTVTMNADSAKAVLRAIQNPALRRTEAIKIARMYGNQSATRKLNEFKIPATAESFANALYAAAHGEKVTDPVESNFFLDTVKPKASQLLLLIQQIEANPQTFQAAVEQRIALFTPPDADIHLDGYIVAAGDGGGYPFGTTDFYLNIGIIDELVLAKGVTTHELYHAVQGRSRKNIRLKVKAQQTRRITANWHVLPPRIFSRGFTKRFCYGSGRCLSFVAGTFCNWNQKTNRFRRRPPPFAHQRVATRDVSCIFECCQSGTVRRCLRCWILWSRNSLGHWLRDSESHCRRRWATGPSGISKTAPIQIRFALHAPAQIRNRQSPSAAGTEHGCRGESPGRHPL